MVNVEFKLPQFNSFLEEFFFLEHCLDLIATLELEKLELEKGDRPEGVHSLENYLQIQQRIAEKLR